MKNKLLPSSFFNPISILGAIIAMIAWITIIFLVVMTKTFPVYNVYNEVFIYLVVPMFLVLGLVLISVGMIIRKRKQNRGKAGLNSSIFVFDLNQPKIRNSVIIFTLVTILFIISTIIGSYQAFHYTESNKFCGTLCHKAMIPEYTAYQISPHARVKCIECHIGEGVDWYVKAKVSGMRQLFHYVGSSYPKPILTPLHNLRPAKETCEKCHWPQKYYTQRLNNYKYFLKDSANTEWDVILDMKIGPSHRSLGTSAGIHWHNNPDVEIQYKANDKRDSIFWIRYFNKKTGVETLYQDQEVKKTKEELEANETRTMDCMDCHNRPAHEYRSPSYFLNNLLVSGKIPSSLPWIKRVAMIALKTRYSTNDSAAAGIREKIYSTYQKKYPEVFQKYEKQIDSATTMITNTYFENTFPEMGISFREYPRNIGHFENDGCFRCHNDRQKTAQGKVLTKDCYFCHTIVKQGKKSDPEFAAINTTIKYQHPVDIENDWSEKSCAECHAE